MQTTIWDFSDHEKLSCDPAELRLSLRGSEDSTEPSGTLPVCLPGKGFWPEH